MHRLIALLLSSLLLAACATRPVAPAIARTSFATDSVSPAPSEYAPRCRSPCTTKMISSAEWLCALDV